MLVGAVALLASLGGHAAQLWLERLGLFGGVPALYVHSLQTPFAQLALALLIVGLFFVARGIIDGVRQDYDGADWLVPALAAIREISRARIVILVFSLQIASLVIGELTEQTLSSYEAFGLGAIFGTGHLTAPFVHAAVGTLAALLLWAFADAVCDRIAAVAHAARLVIAWLSRPVRAHFAPALRILVLRSETAPPPVLARHIACRPPPLAACL